MSVFLVGLLFDFGLCLPNGLALTPPMGWISSAYCSSDCNTHPEQCISDDIVRITVNLMSQSGLNEAGYNVLLLDDCWMAHKRINQNLVPNPARFPNGFQDLTTFLHNMGYFFGLSGSIGSVTKSGTPGSLGHFKEDSQLFAKWKVDYVHINDFSSSLAGRDVGFPSMSYFLNSTERKIVFSCGWGSLKTHYMASFCNVFRALNSSYDGWQSIVRIIDMFENNTVSFTENEGPGAFIDAGPIGFNSVNDLKSQLTMWSMFPSPLFLSANLTFLSPQVLEILKNKNLIALNQDKLCEKGYLYHKNVDISVWLRNLDAGRVAVTFLNKADNGKHVVYGLKVQTKAGNVRYEIKELYSDRFSGFIDNGDIIMANLSSRGTYSVILTPFIFPKDKILIKIE